MPAGLHDGAFIVDTGLNNAPFLRDARQFKAAANSLKNTVNRVGQEMGRSGGAYLKSVQSSIRASREFERELQDLERQAKVLKDALDKPGEGSKSYKAMESAIKEVEAELSKAQKELDAFTGPNAKPLNLDEFAAAKKTVDDMTDKLAQMNAEKQKLATPTASDMAKYQEQVNAYNQVAAKIQQMRQAMAEARTPWVKDWREMVTLSGMVERGFERVRYAAGMVGQALAHPIQAVDRLAGALSHMIGGAVLSFLKKLAAGAKNAAVQLAKIAGRAVTSGMKKLAAYALGAARGLFGLGRGARDSGRGFQFSLKNLLRYGLGIRSLFVLFNRLRSAIKEGFGALKEYDPRVRASLASLSAALNGLKGASAAAFAPILNAIAPALTTLINLVTQATNALGMFFAALTGQSYYSIAKGVASIGSSAKISSGSVKELKRQLAGFDELNILSAGSSGSGSGGGGASSGIGFEQTPIAEGIRSFVADMKALIADEDWDGLGRMLGDKINGVFDRVRAAVSWDTLGERITKVLNGITGTINGFVDEVDWSNIGATFAEGLNTIINTALLWYRGIDWANLGRSLADALNGLIRRINWAKIGDLIQSKLKALFDFTKNFVITFDEIEAAKAIRTALGRIDWPTLARDFWETAKTAFKKAGNFLKVLMGGDVYDVAGDAVDQMWERGSGSASSQTYATSWVRVFAKKIGELLASIPWSKIFEGAKKTIGDAITGLIDGLFGTKEGVFLAKLTGAIVGLKIAIPFMLKGLANKLVSGIGLLAKGVVEELERMGASIWATVKAWFGGGAAPEIEVGGFLDAAGLSSGMATGLELFRLKSKSEKELKEIAQTMGGPVGKIMRVAGAYNIFSEIEKKKRDHAYDEDPLMLARAEAYTKSLQFVADSFEKAGGDVEGWTKAFDANTQATEDNTKAKNKQTKAEARGKAPATVQSTNRPAQTVGAYLRDVFTAEHAHQFKGDASALNIPLNFIPAGAAAYINRPLEYLKKLFAPGTDTSARVNLVRNLWTTVSDWVGGYVRGNVMQGVNLSNAWGNATVNDWVGYRFIKGLVSQGVTLANKWGYATVNDWAGFGYIKGLVSQGVTLANKWGYATVNDWAGFEFIKGLVSQGVTLANAWGYRTVNDWVGARITSAVVQNVQLVISQISSTVNAVLRVTGRAMGGIITAGGRALNFASGGMIRGAAANYWKSIPKYASGTGSAHGTMFVAGEAGPEVVGHVNGRTEILNQSQLAQTMEAATYGGMIRALSGVTFTVPAMATGGVLPYEVSAQIAKSAQDIQRTLDENNEDLIQTIISVAGQIVAAVHGIKSAPQGAGGVTAQQVIDEINRRTQMFSASPLRGV